MPGGAEEVIVGSAGQHYAGYRNYFGYNNTEPLYYRLDIAGWTWLFIDSQNCILTKDSPTAKSCSSNGTNPDGPQYAWLASELATTPPADCTGVAMHDNTLKDGSDSGASDAMDELWVDLLDPAGFDVLLMASEHGYERYNRVDEDGTPGNDNPRPFVVGTGGAGISLDTSGDPGEADFQSASKGILRLTTDSTNTNYTIEYKPTNDYPSVDDGPTTYNCTNNGT